MEKLWKHYGGVILSIIAVGVSNSSAHEFPFKASLVSYKIDLSLSLVLATFEKSVSYLEVLYFLRNFLKIISFSFTFWIPRETLAREPFSFQLYPCSICFRTRHKCFPVNLMSEEFCLNCLTVINWSSVATWNSW